MLYGCSGEERRGSGRHALEGKGRARRGRRLGARGAEGGLYGGAECVEVEEVVERRIERELERLHGCGER